MPLIYGLVNRIPITDAVINIHIRSKSFLRFLFVCVLRIIGMGSTLLINVKVHRMLLSAVGRVDL